MSAVLPPPEAHAEMPKRMVGRRLVRTCSCGGPWPCEESAWNKIRALVKGERDIRDQVANDQTEAGNFDRAERCWGWTDALDWVLVMMDRAAPSAPGTGEKE